MDRGWLKWLVYTVVGTLSFFLFIWLTLPLEPFKKALEARLEAALGNEYDVTILDFGLSGFTAAEAEVIEFRRVPPPIGLKKDKGPEGAPKEKFKPIKMTIDRAEVDFALFKSLFGDTTVNFHVDQGEGTLDGSWSQVAYEPLPEPKSKVTPTRKTSRTKTTRAAAKKDDEDAPDEGDEGDEGDEDKDEAEEDQGGPSKLGNQVKVTFEAFPLGSIRLLEAWLNMPLIGTVSGTFDMLFSASGQMLDGAIDLEVERLALGPGEIPLDSPLGRPSLNEAIRFGKLDIKIRVEGGKMVIDTFKTSGPDIILEANGNITLASRFGSSRTKLNARIKPSKEFLDKNALSALLNTNPKVRRAKAGEWYGLLINGSMSDLGKGNGLYPSSRTASGLGKAK